MGPRFDERGRPAEIDKGRLTGVLQWGRASMSAEGPPSLSHARGWINAAFPAGVRCDVVRDPGNCHEIRS